MPHSMRRILRWLLSVIVLYIHNSAKTPYSHTYSHCQFLDNSGMDNLIDLFSCLCEHFKHRRANNSIIALDSLKRDDVEDKRFISFHLETAAAD